MTNVGKKNLVENNNDFLPVERENCDFEECQWKTRQSKNRTEYPTKCPAIPGVAE